ncbi:MAG: flagellar biosynthesis regulator FlaF [Desulfobacterales bacterium]|nr:MAG: flagellar biosynthesis regulator FlaF [Desulfobacterales bacterium]
MHRNSLNAYQMVEKTTISGRETEARVLTEAAIKLKYCLDNWEAKDRCQKLDEALTYNQRVWTLIQSDLLDKNNPLPRQLRENILSLSAFIDTRIFNIMAYPAPEKLNILIDINLNLAAGLRESSTAAPRENFQAA